MYTKEELSFSTAEISDIEEIIEINKEHKIDSAFSDKTNIRKSDTGFLMVEQNNIKLSLIVEKESCYVVKHNNQVIGYLELENSLKGFYEHFRFQNLIWNSGYSSEIIVGKKHIHINQVAVKKELMGKGIARFMYEAIESIYNDYIITSYVVTKPIENTRSINFHQSLGYKEGAVFNATEYYGFKNYSCILFIQDLRGGS